MPDGQFSRIVCVWPFGLLDYSSATLRCKIGPLPFLGLRPHALHPGPIQGKEGIQFCHLATLPNTHTLTHVFLLCHAVIRGNGLSLIDFGAAAETGACFVSPPAKHLFPDVQKGAELHNLRACTVFPSPLRNLGFREPTF